LIAKEVDEVADFVELAMKSHVRSFSHWAPVVTPGTGSKTAGYTDEPRGMSRIVTLVNNGVTINKVFEQVEGDGTYATYKNFYYTVRHRMRSMMRLALKSGDGVPGHDQAPAAECYQGIELSSFNVNPPWQTTYVNSSSPSIQLRWNFVTAKFEICIWDIDTGTPPTVIETDVNPVKVAGDPLELALDYIPDVATPQNTRLLAYVDRVLVHTAVGERLTNMPTTTPEQRLAGYFMCSGSNPYSNMDAAAFGPTEVCSDFVW
jgi:hypothetical protein